ncbi:MAG: hypothetical protein SFV15_17625 [Polyangiaceae bacterium]|nr:hypothetical protein [Polyangiaceae bacterium]
MSEESKRVELDDDANSDADYRSSPTWLAVIAGVSFLAMAALSVLGLMAAFREGEMKPQGSAAASEIVEQPAPVEAALPAPAVQTCEDAIVTYTGPYDVAVVRQEPAGQQIGQLARGFAIRVCDRVATPGTNIANHWRRISGRSYDGAWISEAVLTFQNR